MAGENHPGKDARVLQVFLQLAAAPAQFRAQHHRVADPGGEDVVGDTRLDEVLAAAIHVVVVAAEAGLAQTGELIQLVELLVAKGGPRLVGDETVAQFLEDEHAVVLDVTQVFQEAAVAVLLAGAVEELLRGAAPGAQHQCAIPQGRIVDRHQTAVAQAGNDVEDREAGDGDVAALAGRGTAVGAAQGVGAVLDQFQVVPVSDVPQAVPVGHAADQRGDQHGAGLGRDVLFDTVDVDLVGVGFDVDQYRHVSVHHDTGNIGAKGQGGGDDFGARGQVQQADGQQQGGAAGVDHHAVVLAQQVGTALLEGGDILADHHAGLHDIDHGIDFFLVEHGAAVADLAFG